MIMNYIAYLIVVFPLIVLYFFVTNPIRRIRNKRVLNKVLKKGGVPKALRKEIVGSYKDFTKVLGIRNIMSLSKQNQNEGTTRGFTIVRK